ncbi:MAG: Bro-N domain-containing protein [Gammaproteobacteria bacterium]|jgi:prophage antirepressor-like protein
MGNKVNQENKIILFRSHKIRRVWHDNEWFFSIIDVVGVLSESSNSRRYWSDLKRQLTEKEGFFQLYEKIVQLKLESSDGKQYKTDCTNTETLFRIIQSIPSPKAEPFKHWLAKVGYERIQEIENPELAQERMKALYEQKGYPKDWIDKRLRGIAIRQDLTDEWKARGITSQKNYAILTSEISKATFGMTPTEYKKHKNIPIKSKANLRDNMTDLELIFTMLGEKVTTEISGQEKPETFDESRIIAKRGGKVAGNARKETEKELGKSVISKENHLGWLSENKQDMLEDK